MNTVIRIASESPNVSHLQVDLRSHARTRHSRKTGFWKQSAGVTEAQLFSQVAEWLAYRQLAAQRMRLSKMPVNEMVELAYGTRIDLETKAG